ncbi:von Willebrand factor type A domain-containing protein [Fusarium flagelliforme]|uniref:von Willebrand factor type A domain-containing protein n=1 Tax=Fusarium flagelliforme TaxID=2675880 RepID=UPI001E8D5260|nr:von Willebrand factor type A domain-containing protein [Fusarium flagelliforme]KAH7185216.1 von Willebrand factor type A domain-containing protein [Fusarium flagelliforme]
MSYGLFGQPSRSVTNMTNCGCYIYVGYDLKYLPQVEVKAHTTILATTSRTNLTQTFINPTNSTIEELRYVFPLYDGVSVVAFTCTVGSKTIKGVVQERQKAQQVYNEAKAKGQVAGLLKQSLEAADVFTTTIGNVPAGEKVYVDITYLGELKHDAQVDGIRFTIPTQVVPRYGTAQSFTGFNIPQKGFSFTVDAEMPDGSSIKSIQSPSHPLSVEIGTTSTTKSQEPSLRRASATLQQGETHLAQDFVVQVVATKLGEPSAILETHPEIPNQRAIMTTLVPKFKLPAEKPEIVFICDRSASMSNQISNLKTALEVFLKSMPVGVKFNICSFGNSFTFLWERSQTYNQENLDQAVQHVRTFLANYGGTEMYDPFQATFKKRYRDMNLEVILLTDGEIWDQDRLFELINDEVAESKGTARVFSLGIGAGASTSLIEGVARAGNGFAQTVADNEKMDKKVVRMLKGALFPHITDYSLEVKYQKTEAPADDDFELVEKVMDSLQIDTAETSNTKSEQGQAAKKPISLFDSSVDSDGDGDMADTPKVDDKFDHLPHVPVPRYLQTPSQIPPLFPFNRTTVYVLLSDATPSQQPKSVVLKGTSHHGPLELEIPITEFTEKDSVIHCLAARKEVKELEEGRGWLTNVKDSDGKFLKEKNEGRFSDLVEREAVRLGVKFQVGGKWCSFVAVEDNGEETNMAQAGDISEKNDRYFATGHSRLHQSTLNRIMDKSDACDVPSRRGVWTNKVTGASPGWKAISAVQGFFGSASKQAKTSGSLFGAAPGGSSYNTGNTGGGLFGSASPAAKPSSGLFGAPPSSSSVFGSASQSQFAGHTAFGASPAGNSQPLIVKAAALAQPTAQVDEKLLAEYQAEMDDAAAMPLMEENEGSDGDEDMGFGLFDDGPSVPPVCPPPPAASTSVLEMGPLRALTSLQTFLGSWSWSVELERVLGVDSKEVAKLDLPSTVTGHALESEILATACAILFFKRKLADEKDTWEMLVEKAEGWLEENIGEDNMNDLEVVLGKLF